MAISVLFVYVDLNLRRIIRRCGGFLHRLGNKFVCPQICPGINVEVEVEEKPSRLDKHYSLFSRYSLMGIIIITVITCRHICTPSPNPTSPSPVIT